jgi:hypothetical protein
MNGPFSRFTTDKLLEFLKRLDQTVARDPHRLGGPYQKVGFGT